MLVSLPSLADPAVAVFVEPANVSCLEAVGTIGTRISVNRGASELTAGPFVEVLGTPAAVAATLNGAPLGTIRILGYASVMGATGAIVPGSGFGILGAGASSVRNGVGDYTVTFASALPAGATPLAVTQDGGDGVVSIDGPGGATQDVVSFDTAGAPADIGFCIFVLGPPA